MENSILFFGAGRLGTTLAKAMWEKGFTIPFFFSKEIPSKHDLYLPETQFLSDLQVCTFNNVSTIIITVPDDQIKNVVKKLEVFDLKWERLQIIHTSGCLSSEELKTLKSKGAIIGSVHPMQTFNDYFLPATIFRNIIFTIEGDNQITNYFENIANLLDASTIKLKPEDKILYHIAAVVTSNFFVALLDYVSQLYRTLNFDDNKIKELIMPILNKTLDNFAKANSKNILTGPLKRGDLGTVEKHINYLKNNQIELLPIYKEISKYISQFLLNNNESETEKLNRSLKND